MSTEELYDSAKKPEMVSVYGSGRRGFLMGLSAVFASVTVGTMESQAGFFSSSKKTAIPASWVRRFGNDVIKYGAYIDRLNLKYISTTQVIAPHLKNRGRIYNSLPPKSYWKKMKKTLKIADMISAELGRGPKDIVSAYRSPRYNRACSGAKSRSMHLQNNALDLVFHASPWTVSRIARALRNKRKFKGGIGRYRGFTHLDTRGYNADW